jgi:hypothetical protein
VAAFRLHVDADLVGLVTAAVPYGRRVEFAQAFAVDYDQASGVSFVAVPASTSLTTLAGVILRSNKTVTVRISGQSDQGITLNPGGILIVFDGTMTGVTVQNNSGATAHIDGAVLGS